VSEWEIVYRGWEPREQGVREALCTLGNGYLATRGAAPECDADDVHYPGTYLAGVYNRLGSEVAGRWVENESLVNAPNWLSLTFRVDDGPWLSPATAEVLDWEQKLDLSRGLLVRLARYRDGQGRVVRLVQRRFVDMAGPHLAGLDTTLTAENFSGRLEVRSALDGTVTNSGVARYRALPSRHLTPLRAAELDGETIELMVETNQSHVRIAMAARTRVFLRDQPVPAVRHVVTRDGYVAHLLVLHADEGESVTIEKLVATYTGRDTGISEPAAEARDRVRHIGGFDDLLPRHTLAWHHLWERCRVDLVDSEEVQRILNLHIFHLLQTTSQHVVDLDVGVPARGLHGEAYRGHVFWDEIFILPFLNLRMPEVSRSLLRYRHRRLPQARWAAKAAGYDGVMFPWQSGSDGREETQTLHLNPKSGRWLPDASHLQRHINLAVAYNVWQYWETTGDEQFLGFYGAELLLGMARFFASLATYDRTSDRYEIAGVMGPDEYHEGYPGAEQPGLRNNAYTNVMTAWLMCRALEVLDVLPEPYRSEVLDRMGLTREETDRWEVMSRRMKIVFHDDGIISQFEGYEDLAELDWEDYVARYGDIQRLDRILEAEGDSPDNYKLSKQADALMAAFLLSPRELTLVFRRLGYELTAEQARRTVEYYMARTSHGSTLSKLVHGWILARIDRRRSWQFFQEALRSDIDDVQGGTTSEGIHLGAMAGTVDMVQRCYSGIDPRGGVLFLDPDLPDELRGLQFDLRYRGRWLHLDIDHERARVEVRRDGAGPVKVGRRNQIVELGAGESFTFELS
jgi:alpha,alpha-trehalase